MPRSDDDYDLVHTYDQGKAGKSKTSRPAVRELGREGAATETILMEEAGEPRTPPTGVRFLFYDQTGTLKQKNPDGSVEAIQTAAGAPTDAEYVTTATNGDLSAESLHSNLSGADLHDPATHGSTHTSGGSDSLDAQALSNFSHSSTHQDGGADQLQVDSLAGDNGSAGQVLQTDGSSLSFGSVGGNTPNWTEDPNSPFTGSGQQSHTFTLASSPEIVRVLFGAFRNTSGGGQAMDLRINGVTGSSYFYQLRDTTSKGPDTKFALMGSSSFDRQAAVTGQLEIVGSAGNAIGVAYKGAAENFNGSALDSGDVASGGTTLSSFTVRGRTGTTSVSARVFGFSV